MDKTFVLNGITFVWDEQKALANIQKHDGISYQQAAEAFFDPFLMVVDASRNQEEQDAVIGLNQRWNLLFVVHMEVEGDRIRIISARKATRTERKQYEA